LKTVGVGFCKCSDGYYYSSSSNSCETCDSSCATCVDANNCLTCKPNSYRASDGSCTCLYNYNLLPPTLSCVPCDEKCRGCTIMASTCSDCAPDSGIITAFPQRTYCKIGTPLVRLANGQASVCHPSCLTCKMGSSLPSSCVTCVPGASVDPTTGFCMCQPGYFMKNDFTACVFCPSPCLTCIPGSANLGICTELISTDPREMQSTTGLTKCRTSNSFYDGSNKVCKPCDSTCKNCKGPLTGDCYSCKDPKAQFITSSPVGSCHCIQGFAMDINGMCVRCHLTCLACSIPGDANSCTACDTGAMVLSGNTCNSSDPTNFPINTTSGMANMYNCHSSCKSCNVANSPTACTSCHLNAQLSSGRCNCRSGYGREPNDPSFICFECHFLCTACDGNNRYSCSACQSTFNLDSASSKCIAPDGSYANYANTPPTSNACDGYCTTCEGASSKSCLSCYNGITPWAGQCGPPDGIDSIALDQSTNDYQMQFGIGSITCAASVTDNTSPSCIRCRAGATNYYGTCYCPPGEIMSSGICGTGPAVNSCKFADENFKCTECYANAYLTVSGECKCLEGYYMDAVSKTCTTCPLTCRTCTSDTVCEICYEGAIRGADNMCRCPTDYSLVNKICVADFTCDVSCGHCSGSSPNLCTFCKSQNTVFTSVPGAGGAGSCTCIDGYVMNNNGVCEQCHPTCKTCTLPLSSSSCTNCPSTLAMISTNTCGCRDGTYMDPTYNCLPCHSICRTCSGSTERDCNLCIDHATKINGECQCDQGYTFTSDNRCFRYDCHYTCATEQCRGPLATDCTACNVGVTLQTNGTCKAPSGKYLDSFGMPQACSDTCRECSGPSPTECTSCNGQAFINSLGECACGVNQKEMPYGNRTCNSYTCHASCATCILWSEKSCLTCKANAILTPKTINGVTDNYCVCLEGFFMDPTTKNCLKCHIACKLCSGPTENDCTQCTYPSFLSTTTPPAKCICPAWYTLSLTTLPTCLLNLCHSSCLTCSQPNNPSACITCPPTYLLSSTNECVCPRRSYKDSSGNCKPCDASCLTCTTASSCATCSERMVLYQGKCKCIPGTYLLTTLGICVDCSTMCLTCDTNNNYCTSCIEPPAVKLVQTSGTQVCQANSGFTFYWISSKVTNPSCHPSCMTCSGPASNQCLSCWQNAIRTSDSTCICLPGYKMGLDSHCKSVTCHPSCQQCSGSGANQCTNCYPLSELTSYPSGECKCFIGSGVGNDGKCHLCYDKCLTCSSDKMDGCILCRAGLIKNQDGTCECPSNQAYNWQRQICEDCHFTCKTCTGTSDSSCLSCKTLAILDQNGTCARPPTYVRLPTGECSYPSCHISCRTCTGSNSDQCATCHTATKQLVGTQCKCRSLTEDPITGECSLCHPTCLTCSGRLETQCISCPPLSVIQTNGTCICKAGYYFSTASLTCESCYFTCGECKGPLENQCTACKGNNVKLSPQGICTCSNGMSVGSTGFCGTCAWYCKTCTNTGLCLSCGEGATLTKEGMCKCEDWEFMQADGSCKRCLIQLCNTCKGPTRFDCLTCTDAMVTPKNGECPCREGQYLNLYSSRGERCESCNLTLNCKTCVDSLACSECNIGWRFDSTKKCVREYYPEAFNYRVEVLQGQIMLWILIEDKVELEEFIYSVDKSRLFKVELFVLSNQQVVVLPPEVQRSDENAKMLGLVTQSELEFHRGLVRYKINDENSREPIAVKFTTTPNLLPKSYNGNSQKLSRRELSEVQSSFFSNYSLFSTFNYTSSNSIQRGSTYILLPANINLPEEIIKFFTYIHSFISLSFDLVILFLIFVRPFISSLRHSRRTFWILQPILFFKITSLLGVAGPAFRGSLDYLLLNLFKSSFSLLHIENTNFNVNTSWTFFTKSIRLDLAFYQGKYTLTEDSPFLLERFTLPSLFYIALWVTSFVLFFVNKGSKKTLAEVISSARVATGICFLPQFTFLSGTTWIAFFGSGVYTAFTIIATIFATLVVLLLSSDILLLKYQSHQSERVSLPQSLKGFLYTESKGLLEYDNETYLVIKAEDQEVEFVKRSTRARLKSGIRNDLSSSANEMQVSYSKHIPDRVGDTECLFFVSLILSQLGIYPLSQSLLLAIVVLPKLIQVASSSSIRRKIFRLVQILLLNLQVGMLVGFSILKLYASIFACMVLQILFMTLLLTSFIVAFGGLIESIKYLLKPRITLNDIETAQRSTQLCEDPKPSCDETKFNSPIEDRQQRSQRDPSQMNIAHNTKTAPQSQRVILEEEEVLPSSSKETRPKEHKKKKRPHKRDEFKELFESSEVYTANKLYA
jgi:hypothetical protein